MKPRDTKYAEAVERNLSNAERRKAGKYDGLTIKRAKTMLGIRRSDSSHDGRVAVLCGMPNNGVTGVTTAGRNVP